MSYDASSRTYQIMPDDQVKAKAYIIEISLSDTFTVENLHWFTVRVLPKDDQPQINPQAVGPSVAPANAGFSRP